MKKFVSYKSLEPVYGIDLTRQQVLELMRQGVFPPGYRVSPGRIGWDEEDIIRYVETRPAWNQPTPKLWSVYTPQTPTPETQGAKPRGRLAGSKVVIDEFGRKRVVPPPLDRPKPDDEAAEPPLAAE